MEILVKTPLGLEEVCAARIAELDPGAEVLVKPGGYVGLVGVLRCGDPDGLYARILSEVLEAESVYRVRAVSDARLEEISAAAVEAARGVLGPEKSFAVRTVRRGRHSFTSLDVSVAVGAAVQREYSAPVNLDSPDTVLRVEIIGEKAYVAVYEGSREWVKMRPGKREAWEFFGRISVVQMPYTGPPKSCREIGARIGRAVQAFEVGELVVAPSEPVDARSLAEFLLGILEGQASRLEVQSRAYARRPRRVEVAVQDLYQLVRARRGEPIIVFEPEGIELSKATERLAQLYSSARRVNFLFGAREGIPKGVYRAADIVIDLAPAMTLPTELAAPTALLAAYTALQLATVGGGAEEA